MKCMDLTGLLVCLKNLLKTMATALSSIFQNLQTKKIRLNSVAVSYVTTDTLSLAC